MVHSAMDQPNQVSAIKRFSPMNPSYNKEPAMENRTMVLVWTVVVVLAIFLIRLLTVQILDHKYHELAQQNAIRRVNASDSVTALNKVAETVPGLA